MFLLCCRGGNVSVLHLRGNSEPWEAKTSVYSTPNYNYTNYPSSNYSRRVAREGSFNVDPGSRELSPVRWHDKEVDGVFLGRSGWVQVQQPQPQTSVERRDSQLLHHLQQLERREQQQRKQQQQQQQQQQQHKQQQQHVTRIKMADYHCSKSEPGKLPDPQRPGYLPLPNSNARLGRVSPSSLDLTREEPITPPPPTPIISPPPAFQDNSNKYKSSPSVRRGGGGGGAFLSRSNAIEVSPPPSPPKFRLSPNTSSQYVPPNRRKMTPSPVKYHQPPIQTKSLEQDTSGRRFVFQNKKDSSSSSSSSFGFRSLDSALLQTKPQVMPRLSEASAFTDSSFGGYESGGDEESLGLSDYSTVTIVNRQSPDIDRVSPSGRQRQQQRTRRSPCQETSTKNGGSPVRRSSSSTSEDDVFRRSGSAHQTPLRGRSPRNVPPANDYRERDVRAEREMRERARREEEERNRVRRSRSLQLPERCSPGHVGVVSPQQVLANSRAARQTAMHSRTVQSEEMAMEAELRREAEEEARVVTEFIQGVRSREAARNLLLHRYIDRDDGPPPIRDISPGSHHVQQQPQIVMVRPQRGRGLTRGMTNPEKRLPTGPSCDYWPHCSHKPATVTPPSQSPVQQGNMRLSQSYPNQRIPTPRDYATRSSPASLERVNDSSPRPRRGNSLNVPSQDEIEASRRYRLRRSPDRSYEDVAYRHNLGQHDYETNKASPVNSILSNSSSSSEVWMATQRLPRMKTSAASTPEDRPGSAPARETCRVPPGSNAGRVDNAQRSLSLPKCFQTGRELPRLPHQQSQGPHYHPRMMYK
ncbi:unnamed protein product [Nesidiocoris tenuis]|uniref:Uncharacterized protein n=1 Tax=Nesidiocoris tenuis TaxID=355587 RepID=A0A6H5GBV0_9HEMI|nr:unnamed protein product [Nesidiocoris tenuis]